MNFKMVSIIVPVYNTEIYLEKCLNSIINQTYENYEAIIVNDGSTDNSEKICMEFAEKYDKIIYLKKENGGLSSARNYGLKEARGDYISFLDSDDYFDKDFLYKMVIEFNKNIEIDIVQCGVVAHQFNSKKIEDSEDLLLSSDEALKVHMKYYTHKKIIRPAVWNKIFKKEVVEHIMFEEGRKHEDYLYTYEALNNCKYIKLIPDALYNHIYDNISSLTNESFNYKDFDAIIALEKRVNSVKTKGDIIMYDLAVDALINELVRFYYNTIKYLDDNFKAKEILDKVKKYSSQQNRCRLNKQMKIRKWLLMKNPKFYYQLMDFIKKR